MAFNGSLYLSVTPKFYIEVLHQTLNPTAELRCKTLSQISRFGVTPNLSSRGLSSFAYLKALRRFGVIYRGIGLSLVLHRSSVLVWFNTGIYTGLSVLSQV